MSKGLLLAGFAVAASLYGTASFAQSSLPLFSRVVKSVDARTEKMTIEHEAISNLDVGEMTLVFKLANADMLKKARVGERIKFSAIRMNGQVTVTSLLNEEAMMNGLDCEPKSPTGRFHDLD